MAYQMMLVEPDTEKALSQNDAESPPSAQQSPYDYASDLGAEQSIQLIQILLTACVGTILYKRGLRRDIHRGERCLWARCVGDLLKCGATYEAFTQSEPVANLQPAETQFWTLNRDSVDPAVADLIDLLERGVFDAIRLQTVDTVQFFIVAQSRKALRIYEKYSFTFTFEEGKRGIRTASVQSSSITSQVDLSAFVKSFESCMVSLCKDMTKMITLPSRRKFGIGLVLNDAYDPHYQPDGFVDSRTKHLAFPLQEGSRKSCYYGGMSSGYHRFTLSLNYLATSDEATSKSVRIPRNDVTVASKSVPATIEFTQTKRDLAMRDSFRKMQKSSSQRGSHLPPTQDAQMVSLASNRMYDQAALEVNGDLDQSIHGSEQTSASRISGSVEQYPQRFTLRLEKVVELKIDIENRENLPSRINSGVKHDSEELKHYQFKVVSHHTASHAPGDSETESASAASSEDKSLEVSCECGDSDGGSKRVKCVACGRQQHIECYGYDDAKSLPPQQHVCYNCLLLPREKALNDWMPKVVRARLALSFLYGVQKASRKDLMSAMRIEKTARTRARSSQQSNVLYEATLNGLLAKEGLVEIDRDHIQAVPGKRRDAFDGYINPLAKIGHHFQVDTSLSKSIRVRSCEEIEQDLRRNENFRWIDTFESNGRPTKRGGYYPQKRKASQRRVSFSNKLIDFDTDVSASGSEL